MDVELPQQSGIELTRRLRAVLPELRVVMLTAHGDPDLSAQSLRAGAVGYVLKHADPQALVSTLRRITGDTDVPSVPLPFVSRVEREGNTAPAPGRSRARLALLSAREEEVLRHLATGE